MDSQKHTEKLYRYQVENHRRIIESQNVLEDLLRNAIATKDRRQQSALLPLYIFLLGAAAEARLMKILLEPKAFTQEHVTAILDQPSQLERWRSLVRLAFLKYKGTSNYDNEVSTATVGRNCALLYADICSHLKDDLRTVIELRNKMAHGQWSKPFVGWDKPHSLDALKISGVHMKLLKAENLMTLILKRGMMDRILDIVRDLAVSPIAFRRDYDEHYKRLANAAIQLRTKSYPKYADNLVNRHQNGIAKRGRC